MLASKTDLVILKTKLCKLKTIPANFSKPSNITENDIVKKIVYDKLIIKVNAIDAKIPSTSGLVTKYSITQANEFSRFKMLTKRYLIVADLLKRLIAIQKLDRLKT